MFMFACEYGCVCVFWGRTNKGRVLFDEPIKEQEEWGMTHGPIMLCPSLKLKVASAVTTITML